MPDLLQHLFGCVCGQNPDHTWSPGGVLLPFCQRCTGLYVGAFVAALMHLTLRPVPTKRWLWLNGGFLLFMVPFGFHWLPQGPVLRTVTGVLFGFGLVAFLRLNLRRSGRESVLTSRAETGNRFARSLVPGLALMATLGLVPWFGAQGNALAARVLMLLAAGGLLALLGLVSANAALGLRWLIRGFLVRPSGATA